MPTAVDFPTIVNQALELFGEVFDNEPALGTEGGVRAVVSGTEGWGQGSGT